MRFRKMRCPYCLSMVHFGRITKDVNGNPVPDPYWQCPMPKCAERIPNRFVTEYHNYQPIVASIFGDKAHGKTVLLASWFYAFHYDRPAHWERFGIYSLNEEAVEQLHKHRDNLRQGILPDLTAAANALVKPAIVQFHNIPGYENGTFLFYDTSGENYRDPDTIGKSARFVSQAETALMIIRVRKFDDAATRMKDSLDTYIRGMDQMNAPSKRQHLVVVYTAADEMDEYFQNEYADLKMYLERGTSNDIDRPDYGEEVSELSRRLYEFSRNGLRAHAFLATAQHYFKSLDFNLISALGKSPGSDGKVELPLAPARLLDPLLLLMDRGRNHAWPFNENR